MCLSKIVRCVAVIACVSAVSLYGQTAAQKNRVLTDATSLSAVLIDIQNTKATAINNDALKTTANEANALANRIAANAKGQKAAYTLRTHIREMQRGAVKGNAEDVRTQAAAALPYAYLLMDWATAAPLPDLIVESLTHDPASPITFKEITFTALVKNVGAGAAGASHLEFRIGGETPGTPAVTFAVPALAQGETFSAVRRMTLRVAQSYRNTAIADINHEVAESNETNNQTIDRYMVTKAAQLDQQATFDLSSDTLGIGGGPNSDEILAQVVRAGLTGRLVEVRLAVVCASGDLVVEIQGVTTAGVPNGTVSASQTVVGSTLPPFGAGGPTFRRIAFSAPASIAAGQSFAIVLKNTHGATTGVCSTLQGPVGNPYPNGDGYFDARPNVAGVWLPLGARADLPFQTFVQ